MRHLLSRRQLHGDAKLLRCPRRPRARRPRRVIVLGLAEPVVAHLRQLLEQLADVRREAAERLEEQRVDCAAVGDGACVLAPATLHVAYTRARSPDAVRRRPALPEPMRLFARDAARGHT